MIHRRSDASILSEDFLKITESKVLTLEPNQSFDSQSTLDDSFGSDEAEIAQTSQERREILERTFTGGALSEDSDSADSQSETSSISTDLPFDISDERNGVLFRLLPPKLRERQQYRGVSH